MLRTTIARSTIPFFNLLASSKWMNLVRKLSNVWLHNFVLYVRTCTPMIITTGADPGFVKGGGLRFHGA